MSGTVSQPPVQTDAGIDQPRLRDVKATGVYLGGVCDGFVRALVANHILKPVRLPSCRRPGELSRRLLFDVRDLDVLIDKWKSESSPASNPGLSAAALKGWKNTPVRKGLK